MIPKLAAADPADQRQPRVGPAQEGADCNHRRYAQARRTSLKKFIERAQLAGRTEVEPVGDVGLSIVNPEKYRYDILAKIADENARLTKAMGEKCQVNVSGLEGRVKWERTAVAELTLYIPYMVEISECVYQP